MLGVAAGGIVLGRLTDKRGITIPLIIGALALGVGYALAAYSPNIWVFIIIHGVLIGALGSSASFGPLMSNTSMFFQNIAGLLWHFAPAEVISPVRCGRKSFNTELIILVGARLICGSGSFVL